MALRRTRKAAQDGRAASLLRFITCGSVDDGKSTLIGRLLYDSKLLLEDQLARWSKHSQARSAPAAASSISHCCSTAWRPSANRASPSTSPTATSPRAAALHRRRHARPRAVHAQHGDRRLDRRSGVILIDARKGVLTQTRRHSFICLAARHPPRGAGGEQDGPGGLLARSDSQGIEANTGSLPCRSQIHGDHLYPGLGPSMATTSSSARRAMAWYRGPTLIDLLETVEVDESRARGSRSGCRSSGSTGRTWTSAATRGRSPRRRADRRRRARPAVRPGEPRVARIVTADGDLRRGGGRPVDHADAGGRDRHLARRSARARRPAGRGGQSVRGARWSGCTTPLLPGRTYLLKIGTRTVTATVTSLKYKINVNNLEHWRPRRSSSTRSASASCRARSRRSPSILTR